MNGARGLWARLCPGLLALVLLVACDGPELPPVPTLELEEFAAPVRQQIETARQTLQAAPDDAGANGGLAMTLHAYGLQEAADQLYRRAAALEPRAFRWHYYAALTASQLGHWEVAEKDLRSALEQRPDDYLARLRLADLMAASEREAQAEAALEELVSTHPDRPEAVYRLAELRLANGRQAEGIAGLQRAVELYGPFGEAYYKLALALRSSGDVAVAEQQMANHERFRDRSLVYRDPLLAEVQDLNRGEQRWNDEGRRLLAAGRLEAAASAFQKALEVNPDSAVAHASLLGIHVETGDRERAEAHYRAGYAANPDLLELHLNYTLLKLRTGELQAAREHALRAVSLSGQNSTAQTHLGLVREQEGRLDAAMEHYRQALGNDPDNRQARFLLGDALLRSGQPAEAVGELRQSLQPVDARTPWIMLSLGRAYAENGELDRAVQTFDEARRLAEAGGNARVVELAGRDLQAVQSLKALQP